MLTPSLVQGWAQLLSKQVGGYPVPCTEVGVSSYRSRWEGRALTQSLVLGLGVSSYRSRWEGRVLTQSLVLGLGVSSYRSRWEGRVLTQSLVLGLGVSSYRSRWEGRVLPLPSTGVGFCLQSCCIPPLLACYNCLVVCLFVFLMITTCTL